MKTLYMSSIFHVQVIHFSGHLPVNLRTLTNKSEKYFHYSIINSLQEIQFY